MLVCMCSLRVVGGFSARGATRAPIYWLLWLACVSAATCVACVLKPGNLFFDSRDLSISNLLGGRATSLRAHTTQIKGPQGAQLSRWAVAPWVRQVEAVADD